ncbi:pseudouridine synthase [Nitratireductor thuwali]|uniref:Pseudouridine synthase n=1 Tax=Nitratireductor thuwali TaxID=2267699 RepID=A0ABY5MRK4_9HYPH|nr:Ribosomal large subunit pseudouridine synthase B [Nitratireductor thuwali]
MNDKPYRPRGSQDRKAGDGKPARAASTGKPRFGGKPGSPAREGGKVGPARRPEKPKGAPHGAPRPPKEGGQAEPPAAGERIAKRLARAGVASRRDAEAMIEAGRVKVNGRALTSPAFNVSPADRIELDDAPIPDVERTRLFLFHKPAGVVTTSRDPEGRRTIFDILPPGLPRLITVGRLDINTEGLLILTNDGGLARVLELPSTGWLRRYRVRVHGKVDPLALAELEKGIAVDGVYYGAIEATLDRTQGTNAWLTLGLREGKNREVRNVLGALGLDVTRLIRISYGPFQLGALAEGAVQEIKGRMLRDQLGERLIAEARADFDAPITTPFSNKPVRAEKPVRAAPVEAPEAEPPAPRPPRERERQPINRKREREEKREEIRGRLQTRPPSKTTGKTTGKSAGKPAGRRDEEKRKPIERRSRAANVWMAPGARPLGTKKREEKAAADARSERRGAEGPDRAKQAPGADRPRRDDRKAASRPHGPRTPSTDRGAKGPAKGPPKGPPRGPKGPKGR